MKKRNEYIEKEIDFLKQNYVSMTYKQMGQALKRTAGSIHSKLHSLGLTGKKFASW
jgi:hypothetical protein